MMGVGYPSDPTRTEYKVDVPLTLPIPPSGVLTFALCPSPNVDPIAGATLHVLSHQELKQARGFLRP